MKDIITYAKEYRWIDWKEKPFCEADSLILSQISYYNYDECSLVRKEFDVSLQIVLQNSSPKILDGVQTIEYDKELIKILSEGGRHGSFRVCNFVKIADDVIGEQFSAITFELKKGEYYIAFRGTDNSVTGWKEDMCLSYQKEIPSQKTAVRYVTDVMNRISGKFYLGGHSKGGNLAIYSAMYLSDHLQERLLGVFNHDGPGFLDSVYKSDAYRKIRPIIRKTVPQSSIVGMLLEQDNNYSVIRSSGKAIQQHDLYTWVISNGELQREKEIDKFSYYTKQILEQWMDETSYEDREEIIEIVFDTISDMGINWFRELNEERIQKAKRLIKSISGTDDEERKLVGESIKSLLRISAEELQQAVEAQTNSKKEEILILRDSLIEKTLYESIKEFPFKESLKESIDNFKKKINN